jgi:hypothetical protein
VTTDVTETTGYGLTANRGAATAWLPPTRLIAAKILDLRRRNVLMLVTVLFTVALPIIFYGIRLIYHVSDPTRYAPAGAPGALATAGTLMAEFGYIAAVALGATAATDDLTEGMFRHLVITGRSRVALYLARLPAGLAILLGLAAVGYTIAALTTAFLAGSLAPGTVVPSAGALADAGLWIELYLAIGYTVGHGLASLMSQRTVPIILLIVLEMIIVPALTDHTLPHFVNVERLFAGVAMAQLKPAALAGGTRIGPTGGLGSVLPPMPGWALVAVIGGWIVGWSVVGAWKMVRRDA